ncbi:unnamed protein product, partial [Vitis vinifera]
MVALRFKFIKWLCCDITQRKQLIREMECNKDEATRAKEIAEKKFIARDIAGAKKLALKAQNLFPGLNGLPQMLLTLDVHISAENKINGEADWYGILGVNPLADDDTVRKQYRKERERERERERENERAPRVLPMFYFSRVFIVFKGGGRLNSAELALIGFDKRSSFGDFLDLGGKRGAKKENFLVMEVCPWWLCDSNSSNGVWTIKGGPSLDL